MSQDIYLPFRSMITKKFSVKLMRRNTQFFFSLENKFLCEFPMEILSLTSRWISKWIFAIRKYVCVNFHDIYLPCWPIRTKKRKLSAKSFHGNTEVVVNSKNHFLYEFSMEVVSFTSLWLIKWIFTVSKCLCVNSKNIYLPSRAIKTKKWKMSVKIDQLRCEFFR